MAATSERSWGSVKGLGMNPVAPAAVARSRVGVVVGGRHDQDGQAVGGGLAEAGEQLGGVGAGEVEVDQDQVGVLGLDHAQALVEVAGRHDLVAVDQDGGGDLGDRVVVVEDEHLGRGLDRRGDLGRGLGAGPAGRPPGQVGVGGGPAAPPQGWCGRPGRR